MSKQLRKQSYRPITDGLAVSDVSHGFDDSDVLEAVSLSVQQGETLAVIGPSGTGKTTLLRLLALFDRPDAGTVQLHDDDLWALSERERLDTRRQIGMVFQEANLFDTTVRQNVSYGLRVRRSWRDRFKGWLPGVGSEETTPAVTDALAVVGLADAAEQQASSLSGGEAQRVALARTLAYEPDYLLLDEPTSDLDPRNTALIEEAVDTTRAQGRGVVIATHDMHQAERIADRVAVMLDGKIIELGPTDRVFDHPDDPRARKFIDGELVY